MASNYLFFDLECSEGKSVCSFGYVLTDGLFNILEKKDILINPQAIFHTGPWSKKGREKDEGIVLAYSEETFRSQPIFPVLYDKITQVIKRPDTKIVGFSLDNDARFLNYACLRYQKPLIEFEFYDVQRIYQDIKELKDQIALEKLIDAFNVDVSEFTQHKSSDDAHITLLITQALCKDLEKSLETLVEEHPRCKGDSVKYVPRDKKKGGKGRKPYGKKPYNPQNAGGTAPKNRNNSQRNQSGSSQKNADGRTAQNPNLNAQRKQTNVTDKSTPKA